MSAADDLAALEARRTAIYAKLADTTLDAPNASGSGHTIDRVGYRDSLLRELEQINKEIARLSACWEVMT